MELNYDNVFEAFPKMNSPVSTSTEQLNATLNKKSKRIRNSCSSGSDFHDDPEYIPPSRSDMLLSDFNEEKVKNEVACQLEVEYLAKCSKKDFPLRGLVYGSNKRCWLPLRVRYDPLKPGNGKTCNDILVIFLVDTGSPVTYITIKALEHLKNKQIERLGSVKGSIRTRIEDELIHAHYTDDEETGHSEINLLGADYLDRAKLSITINYENHTLIVNKP